ncbi:MAG: PhoH family protein [Phycisphaerales bacterium]|nr:PhoH family protein [Phycisphaerales bacterium]
MSHQGHNGNGHIKTFVLDTNVLLHNPNALFLFEDNEIVIPLDVIEELDKFKANNDDLGRNARTVIRHLDRFREAGNLSEGVTIPQSGGRLRVILEEDQKLCPGLTNNTPDNRIICCAFALRQEGKRVVFISKDINARLKSDALGITTEDFEAQKVDFERLYTGYRELPVPQATIDELYARKSLELSLDPPLNANEFVLLRDEQADNHTAIARFRVTRDQPKGALFPLKMRRGPVFGIMPRNLQQTMALDLLLDDSIKLVSLIGTAGTGKTLLAIAAGMSKVLNENAFQKLLCARPIMPLGRDIGYLPGDKDQKLTAWMQPIFDNMAYLLSNRLAPEGDRPSHEARSSVEQLIQQLVDSGQVVLEPLTYIRGRSIPHQFMIVDEAQNLTPHEVKTIASRVGEGTKLVLTGDATQIDNPYLDSSSNGLSYIVERLKNKPIVGHMTLVKSERSELASLVTAEL